MFFDSTDIKTKTLKLYKDVDFSILPLELEIAYKSDDYNSHLKLYKLSPFLKYYEEYQKSFRKNNSRNFSVYDYYDVIAFMIRNSTIVVSESEELALALNHFDKVMNDSPEKLANILFEEAKTEKLAKYITTIDQMQNHHEKTLKSIKAVQNFFRTYRVVLKEKFLFVSEKQVCVETKLGKLFNELPFHFQQELATMEDIDSNTLLSRPVLFAVVYKKLHPESVFPKELSFRHPFLILLRGSLFEIVGLILGKFPDRETINDRCKNYSLITSYSEKTLLEKCLQSMNSQELKTLCSDALRTYD